MHTEKYMDAKITKQRLTRLLSYDWLKIIALILGICVFWALIFTTTATRITTAQQFTVFNYYTNAAFTDTFSSFYGNSIQNGVYSHEVLELTTNDLVTAGDAYNEILQTRLTVEEGDVMFLPDIGDENYKTTAEDGTVSYQYTYVDSFMASGYGYSVVEFDGYLNNFKTFLEKYFTDLENGESMNKALVESDFRARIAKNKDKRYKKAEQIQAGLEGEYKRMEKYRAGYIQLNGYLESGLIQKRKVTITNPETSKPIFDGTYALNICPDESKLIGLKKYVHYRVTGEKGALIPTAENMSVMFFNFTVSDDGYQYENVLFLNKVMENALAAQ
jgi:hypothetical protein